MGELHDLFFNLHNAIEKTRHLDGELIKARSAYDAAEAAILINDKVSNHLKGKGVLCQGNVYTKFKNKYGFDSLYVEEHIKPIESYNLDDELREDNEQA